MCSLVISRNIWLTFEILLTFAYVKIEKVKDATDKKLFVFEEKHKNKL